MTCWSRLSETEKLGTRGVGGGSSCRFGHYFQCRLKIKINCILLNSIIYCLECKKEHRSYLFVDLKNCILIVCTLPYDIMDV